MKFSTKAVHAGQKPDPTTGAVMTPVFLTSTYAQEELGKNKGYEYSRVSNPTRTALEQNIAALESASEGIAFASGMAAIDALFRLLSPGDHAIVTNNVYGGTYRIAKMVLEKYGLQFDFVDTGNMAIVLRARKPNTKMIFVETPTNPTMEIADLSAIAKFARTHHLLSAVDNTFATPYLQRPIELGIVSCEKAGLEALASALAPAKRDAWAAELAAARQKFEDQNAEYYKTGLGYKDAVHPAVIAKELSDFLYRGDLPKEQTTAVAGGYGIARYTRRYLRAYRPGQICNGAYQYGAIGPDCGYAFGVAQAVQLGAGPQAPYQGAPIVAMTGDAGFAYSAMEVETMSKYRVPVVLIVYNNNAWGIMTQGKPVHMYLFQENLRYEKIAEALGARGEYVTRPEDFLPVLKRSYQIAAKERVSTVINCQAKREFWTGNSAPGFLGKVEPGCMAYGH